MDLVRQESNILETEGMDCASSIKSLYSNNILDIANIGRNAVKSAIKLACKSGTIDTLDLHGFTRNNAHQVLDYFFSKTTSRVSEVITGIGQGIIKDTFIEWASQNHKTYGLLALSAFPHGGAFYVISKS